MFMESACKYTIRQLGAVKASTTLRLVAVSTHSCTPSLLSSLKLRLVEPLTDRVVLCLFIQPAPVKPQHREQESCCCLLGH